MKKESPCRTGLLEKNARRDEEAHLTPTLSPERRGRELELLTQEEVAARLKVTVRTVARLQHDGVIPFILLGKSVRFFWPTVVSHLNANFTVCRGHKQG